MVIYLFMMKIRLIENEIKKMKSLIGYGLGQSISEQTNDKCPDGLEKVGARCCLPQDKKIPRGVPKTGPLRDIDNKTFSLYAWGEFPSGVDKNPVMVSEFVDALQLAIDSSPQIDTEQFDVNIAFAQIYSSASNELNGPVKAGHANKDFRVSAESGHKHTEPESFFTGSQRENEELAANRGVNLWNAIKTELSVPDSKIKIILDPTKNGGKPFFDSWVTDTGGCIDSRRDINKYKNPGQIVALRVTLELVRRGAEEERKCLTGMKVIVGYYAPETAFDTTLGTLKKSLNSKKITQGVYDANVTAIEIEKARSLKLNRGRASINTQGKPGGHSCNKARFAIFMNDIRVGETGLLGVINLNNAGGNSDSGNPIGQITVKGGSREGSVVVSSRQAFEISNTETKSDGLGSVTIQIKGLVADSHNDVPWITIVTGQGKVLMNKQADKVKGYKSSRGKTGKQDLFGPFDPCEIIN